LIALCSGVKISTTLDLNCFLQSGW